MVVISATSLDDPSIYKPAMDIYTSSAQPWDVISPRHCEVSEDAAVNGRSTVAATG
jgi:hypothetical protein